MKKLILSLALFAGLFSMAPATANAGTKVTGTTQAASVNIVIGVPRGGRPFYATVAETVIIGYTTRVDIFGRMVIVPVYGVQYRTVLVQWDRFARAWYYINAYGQAVPYYGAVPRI